MSKLNKLINSYADTARILGDTETRLSDKKIDDLKHELSKISSKNKVYFVICVSMVILMFILSLVLVIMNMNDPSKIQIIFSVTGVSIMGLVIYMHRLWKEKVNSDLLITLVGTLESDVINSVLSALINKI